MIYDRLANAHRYRALHPLIAQGLDWLVSRAEGPFAPGREAISGEALFATAAEYLSKEPAAGKWESHRVHADIQFIHQGEELMGHAPVSALAVREEYDAAKDRTLYHDPGAEAQYLRYRAGWFAIYFPEDGHKPDLAVAAPALVRKTVVKVRL